MLERTIYDKNKFVMNGTTTDICLYDKNGNISGYAKIDTEDVERCQEYKWYLSKSSTTNYVRTSICGKKVTLHSFIMNNFSKLMIDHIDGDGTNNTKANLRLCTNQENSRNRHSISTVGVNFEPDRNKWCASITVAYKRKFLGRFKNYEDAVCARLAAEKMYFGEFAPQTHRH